MSSVAVETDQAYPIALDLSGRPCVVVGGGRVAARKVEGLLAAGGAVRVVAPELAKALERRVRQGAVTWRQGLFDPSDLDGVSLAFVATSNREANARAAAEAKARGVWVNVADDPGASDFHVPATLRRGRLCVAVSTGGASPALAAWVRDRLAESLPEAAGMLAEIARVLRRHAGGGSRRYGELFDSGILEDLARRDWMAADRKVASEFGRVPSVAEILGRPSPEAK
jgi:precorrin-2 dehydrogenase/sirohydrochlorin ferrochelatase